MGDAGLGGVERALVVGLGRSGHAAVEGLVAAGVSVVAVDEAGEAETPRFGGDVSVHVGAPAVEHLDGMDLVVPSPAIPEHAAVIERARELDLAVWSEPELGWRLAPRRVVGVTGTNGKTSVTELTTAMLVAAGVGAVACGNIGNAFTTAARAAAEDAVLVAELSSFQLRFCHRMRVEVGVLLNLVPDHLDWHGSFAAYGAAKARMWQTQAEGDWAVVNAADPHTIELAREHAPGRVARFAGSEAAVETGVTVRDGVLCASLPGSADGEVVALAELALDAPHHVANAAAAACAALLAGADVDAVRRAAGGFAPGRHRLEVVRVAGGLTFVDDSKATNVGAAAAALRSFPSIVWIAGGRAKGVDLAPLAEHLDRVRHAVLIGEAADELAEVCTAAGVPAARAASMDEAVARAVDVARPGDTVLLAPACASFDMFDDYADRGDRFAAAAAAAGVGRGSGS